MKSNKIVHLADLHVRNSSRHQEFEIVFERIIEDIKKEKPRYITILGDIFHAKINLMPNAITLVSNFIIKLSKISDVHIIMGNHDTFVGRQDSGDSITPIIELLENGFVIPENYEELPKSKIGNSVYFFKYSGIYNIDSDIEYIVYSLWDNKIPILNEKKQNKKYIGLYHGMVYGSRTDSGILMKSDDLMKTSILSQNGKIDMIFLGDIHEFDSFEINGKDSCAYAGSCLQNNYGESIDKGYLLWDINSCTFERRFIPNDYGFYKLNISKGEDVYERLDNIQFSLNKKKTKIQIILEDDEENYSLSKMTQIEKFIKDRHGCETVSVDFRSVYREKSLQLGKEEIDHSNSESFELLLIEYLKQNDYDNIEDVISLSKDIDIKLGIVNNPTDGLRIEFNKMEVSNIYSFPLETTVFDFDKLNGVTGIFGKNYTGKSNLIKVLVWILYQKILGDGDVAKVVNMYTNSNKAWGKLYFTIAGKKYLIHRSITVGIKKDGTPNISYGIIYKYESSYLDEDGETKYKWVDSESEEAATEKKEVKKLIVESLGEYDHFVLMALQGVKQDYLNLAQQPKNELISKFLGLEPFAVRYEFGNETFKKIKANQKSLGDPIELEKNLDVAKLQLIENKKALDKLNSEKETNDKKIEDTNKNILEETKKLHKIDKIDETDESSILIKIKAQDEVINKNQILVTELEDWLKINFKKDLPVENATSFVKAEIEKSILTENYALSKEQNEFDILEPTVKAGFKKEMPSDDVASLDKVKLESEISKERDKKTKGLEEWKKLDAWIKSKDNEKKEEKSIVKTEEEIESIKNALIDLKNQLKIAKGEKCPICNHVAHEANPKLEKECLEKIGKNEELIQLKNSFIIEQKNIVIKNNFIDKEVNRLEALMLSLRSIKSNLDELVKNQESLLKVNEIKEHNEKFDKDSNKLNELRTSIQVRKDALLKLNTDLELSIQITKIVDHNKSVEEKSLQLTTLKGNIEICNKETERLSGQIDLLKKNEKSIKDNKVINDSIKSFEDDIVNIKIINLQVLSKIKEAFGNIKLVENNNETILNNLNLIKESERIYRKYSIYLQAMDKDGIPANIIKKKLPIINHKINSITKDMVKFKIEMYIKPNGDIKEMFYFRDSKTDTLPLDMGSGSVKFISSIAIRDALHFVSKLIKPSLCSIDEGFGTLDENKLLEVESMFSYLKNKYKNVFVITHKSEVKDFVDNVIDVSKSTEGLDIEELRGNPEAGVSKYRMS